MMATASAKNPCDICGKDKASFRCEGCSRTFCFNHVTVHRQELSKQLDEIEVARDLFRQTLTEQTTDPRKHPLIQKIDQWEEECINKVRRAADEKRELLLAHTTGYVAKIEAELMKLTDQLRQNRQENDFIETDLQHWKNELARLAKEFGKALNISIRQGTTPLVTNISVDVSMLIAGPNIDANARWVQNGVSVAGANGQGNGLNQLTNPYGLDVTDDQTIYVAEYNNHRVMEWKNGATSGRVVAGGTGQGNQANQLSNPTAVIVDKETDSLIIADCLNKRVVRWSRQNGTSGETIMSDVASYGLAMDSCGYLYVSDYSKHEVKRWKMGERNGTVVAGGNGKGNRLDQLDSPLQIFVDDGNSVYVADYNNHRVMKWMEGAKEGIVVAGGQGAGSGLTQLSSPQGVVVDQLGTVYVADGDNHRVVRWGKGASQGSVVVGGNGVGAHSNQFNRCSNLSFDQQGNLYVSDYNNHRVQKFNIDPNSNP